MKNNKLYIILNINSNNNIINSIINYIYFYTK